VLALSRVSRHRWRRLGWLRRWLITSRAGMLSATAASALFGGLLALPWTPGEGLRMLLVTAALMLAHATGNLLADAAGWLRSGRQRNARLGLHPLARGLMGPGAFLLMLVATGALALLLGMAVCRQTGAAACWLAGVGALLVLLYTWPLKRLGLGEAVVFLVWGPLMAGGTYWMLSGDWGDDIALQTSVFGLGAAVVVFAKHTDQRRDDAARGIRTLPVLLGPVWAPRCLAALAVGQVGAGLSWATVTGNWGYLLLLTSLPSLTALLVACLRRRPAVRPRRFPADLWPWWYTMAGSRFARASSLALLAAALLHGIG
jgi:1,4-dihydroxy-2-naphthoate polyprenyltransferase